MVPIYAKSEIRKFAIYEEISGPVFQSVQPIRTPRVRRDKLFAACEVREDKLRAGFDGKGTAN
jgi:hypothetical protein